MCGSFFIYPKGGDFIRKLYRLLFSRMTLLISSLLVQLVLFLLILARFSHLFFYVYLLLLLLSGAVVFHISGNDRLLPELKLAWVIPIMLFPLFGGILYLVSDMGMFSRGFRRKLAASQQRMKQLLLPNLKDENHPENIALQIHYFEHAAHFPCYDNTISEYLSPGEPFFIRLKEELEKAEHSIFLEFFIIDRGVMWEEILKILRRKAKQGLDIRLIYDDVGCLKTLPFHYDKFLEGLGIRCRVFSPFHPVLSRALNSRDHRKLVIIDGHTAFTGGINLADEYINLREIHGHWKDAGILLHGEGVWNFTVMFLSMWDLLSGEADDFYRYRPHQYHPEPFLSDGLHIPFGGSPDKSAAAQCYLNVIHQAKTYLYLDTPYLIADNNTVSSLCLAAKNGVDVRIITPGIPDKWYVHMMTRSFYPLLIESGVRIYEYTPGFVHAKCLVCDDEIGIVGSINLDFRSLYQQFECAVWMYQSRTITHIKADFLEMLRECREITLDDCRNVPWYIRLLQMLMRVFAPLM